MRKITKIEKLQQEQPSAKLRVAAYCRVSTDSDAQLESLEAQKTHYERYISSRQDWEFAGLYYDEGISGTKKEKRSELLRLMADCEARKIDYVITKSISRFSRNTTDCLELVRSMLDLNIPIYFEKENLDTSSMESELFLSILSSMAEGESTSIAENSKWSIQKRFQRGTYKIAYPPYGYSWNGEEMVIEPIQAAVVKRIFADVLSGCGTDFIAKQLNTEKIPTKRNGRWTATTIRGMLTNEKYTGDVIFQKTYTDSQFNRHSNNGEKDQYMAIDHHEAIIDKMTFQEVQALIQQRASEKGILSGSEKYQNRYAFSGHIICGECGSTFKRRVHSAQSGKYAAWCCNTHITDNAKCSMLFIRDEDLKLSYLTMLNKLIFSRDILLAPLLEQTKNDSEDDGVQRIRQLETQLMQLTEQRQTLQRLMAHGYLDQVIFTQQKNELMTQTEAYRQEIESLQNGSSKDTTRLQELTKLLNFVEHCGMLERFTDELFTKYADRIIVYSRHEVGFQLKCGLTLKERM